MKTFARLIRRYVLATAGIILVVVALLLGMTIYAGVRYNDASDSVQKVGTLAEALHPTADGLQWDAAHTPVSYTHLDVYKRQRQPGAGRGHEPVRPHPCYVRG